MSQRFQKHAAHRLARCRVVANLVCKKCISVKHSKGEHIKTRHACMYFIFSVPFCFFCCGGFSDTPLLTSLWLCLLCCLACLLASPCSHIRLSLLLLRGGRWASLLLVSAACMENCVVHYLVYLL